MERYDNLTASDNVALLAVGDIMVGDLAVTYGAGVGSHIERFGPLFPFAKCLETLRSGDITVGNLEVVLSHYGKDDAFERQLLRGQPISVEGLAAAGFNVLSLANNHIMQHGQKALEETVTLLREHGIGFVGLEMSELGVTNFCSIERKGITFGFLGYNFRPEQYFLDKRRDVPGSLELIISDIERYRPTVDHMIVSVHWGDEFISYPSRDQIKLGREIIAGGASVLLGHHPHILQGIEKHDQGLIAYSLGNFVFDMWQPRLRKSMILKCTFSGTTVVDYNIIPVIINESWQPEIIEGRRGEELKSEIYRLNGEIAKDSSNSTNYTNELQRLNSQFRREVWWYYLTHFYRYDRRRLVDNVVRVIRNRVGR